VLAYTITVSVSVNSVNRVEIVELPSGNPGVYEAQLCTADVDQYSDCFTGTR